MIAIFSSCKTALMSFTAHFFKCSVLELDNIYLLLAALAYFLTGAGEMYSVSDRVQEFHNYQI